MDVTCERCGTEYEFDETLVSDRGTTVKCTNCGHLFKVFRQGGVAVAGGEPRKEDTGRIWQLRTQDGETQQFGSLKELQRLIVEGRVSEEDKLTRRGEGWKRLGDIAELQTFFAAARAARPGAPVRGKSTMLGVGAKAALPVRPDASGDVTRADLAPQVTRPDPARGDLARMNARDSHDGATPAYAVRQPLPREPRGTFGPTSAPRPPTPASVAPPPRPRGDETERGIGQKTDNPSFDKVSLRPTTQGPPRPTTQGPPPPPTHAPPPPPPRARAEESPTEKDATQRPPTRTEARPPKRGEPTDRTEAPRAQVRALHVDEEETERPAPKRGLTGVVVGLATLVLLGGLGAWLWPRFFPTETAVPETPAARFVNAGEAALGRDRIDAYEDAAGEFNKALAFDENDVRAQVGLSRAHALRAQAQLFEADDIEARAGTDEALRAEATILRRQAVEAVTDARTYAESAVHAGTGSADAEVALADALRLGGERDLSRSRLDRARTLESTPSSETLRVEALWTAGPTGLTSARALAAQAAQASPPILRAQLLLARVAIASGDPSGATTAIDAVLAIDALHPEALRLRDRALNLAAPLPTDAPVEPVPNTAEVPAVAVLPTGVPTTPNATEGTPQARDYSGLVREGHTRLERGQVAAARQSFEAALQLRAGTPEAMTGLGYVMLEEGNASGAARQFSSAATNGNGSALIGLGDAYRRLNQREQALEAYRRYLQLLPNGSDANLARRQVEQLGAGGSSTTNTGGSTTTTTGSESGGNDLPSNPPVEAPPPPVEETPPPPPEPAPPAIESEP